MNSLDQLLAKSKELREAATPGPWYLSPESTRMDCEMMANQGKSILFDTTGYQNNDMDNFHFVAHARNTLEAKDQIIALMRHALLFYAQGWHYRKDANDDLELENGEHAAEAVAKAEEIAKGVL